MLLISALLNKFSAAGAHVVSINMPYSAAFCVPFYCLLGKFIFKQAVNNQYLHVLYFPLAATLSSMILFYYSWVNQTEGVSFFAEKIASAPIFYATGAGTLSLFLVLALVNLRKPQGKPKESE